MAISLDQSAFMTTYSGKVITVFDPKAEQIDITDIAQALSMLCRFTGHTSSFYSVAQHSVLVSMCLPSRLGLQGLLHDAQEAYIGDLSRPVKHHPGMQAYRELETRLEWVIRDHFDLPRDFDPMVKTIDNLIVIDEAKRFMSNLDWTVGHPCLGLSIRPWSPEEAKSAFLDAFRYHRSPRITIL